MWCCTRYMAEVESLGSPQSACPADDKNSIISAFLRFLCWHPAHIPKGSWGWSRDTCLQGRLGSKVWCLEQKENCGVRVLIPECNGDDGVEDCKDEYQGDSSGSNQASNIGDTSRYQQGVGPYCQTCSSLSLVLDLTDWWGITVVYPPPRVPLALHIVREGVVTAIPPTEKEIASDATNWTCPTRWCKSAREYRKPLFNSLQTRHSANVRYTTWNTSS